MYIVVNEIYVLTDNGSSKDQYGPSCTFFARPMLEFQKSKFWN